MILTKEGAIVQNGKTVASDPLMFLSAMVNLETGYTLRSYFQLLERYALLRQLNPFFPSYLEQYHASPKSECIFEGFDHLELSKTVEMIGFPGKPRLEIYSLFYGVHGSETGEIKSIQIGDLLDMPVTLGKLKHIVFGDKVDIFEFDTVFNLFEFIEGIAWELSFHGTPRQCELRR